MADKSINEQYFNTAVIIANRLSIIRSIEMINLIGSVANGNSDKYSDIDLLVFYKQKPTNSQLQKALQVLVINKFQLNGNKFHIHLCINNTHITLLFIPFNYIKKLVFRYPCISYEEYKDLFTYFVQAYLLFGDKKLFLSWKRKTKTIPKFIKKDVILNCFASLNFWFSQSNLLFQAKRKDWLFVYRVIHIGIEYILTVIYLINNQVFINSKRAKLRIIKMKKKPSSISLKLEKLIKMENSYFNIKRKVKIVNEIITDLKIIANL